VKRSPILAGILSLFVPGLGQIYGGHGNKGAAIIVGAVVVANLNVIILPLIAIANPNGPVGTTSSIAAWRYWIPRVGHDVASLWSIVFWIWAIVDAVVSVYRSNFARARLVKVPRRSRK
jgi:TM2 domain-containing membrane protein YozV